ncbi:hypothetical protein JCM9140_485 [Halalkalibacter wakoensis JCM 9140]|uniref:Uncharacterized protein n=1 Tax=Halalkalibacter wakoensis JCM 9140 TaxID=1236970 RepID=W4PYK1_9BACI|nr:hypothetical protein [Halalkalibacter wakoensis]GAE24548.1 hypothetical protein JCM9140_485 [Halalkalibacter wakoensis JCM 9140]
MFINSANTGGSSGAQQFPLLGFFDTNDDTTNIKEAHDSYDIYVNEEFIGKKVLLTQNEHVDDVVDFLKKQGVQNISGKLSGDHYSISSEESEHVKQILETYLNNR